MNYPARPSSQQLRYTTDSLHDSGKLRRWKGGAAAYQSVIFIKREGGICYTAELRGETKFVGDEIIRKNAEPWSDASTRGNIIISMCCRARSGLIESRPYSAMPDFSDDPPPPCCETSGQPASAKSATNSIAPQSFFNIVSFLR